jgi:hypothetical protein
VTQYATELARTRLRHSARARAVLAIGPVTVLAGVLWAFLQPWRMTILHPRGESFWWLVVEPPLLVALVGVCFYLFVARPVVHDLEESG